LVEKIFNLVTYRIPYDEFFSFQHNSDLKNYFEKHSRQCQQPINELIKKYNLSKSKVLSIGPKTGHEEYWFYRNDCDLTFIDMDEDHNLKPLLEKLSSNQLQKSLTYIIDDARNFQKYVSKKFDVVYFSSFTPNELRNWDVVSKRKLSFGKKIINRIGNQLNISSFNLKWPPNIIPFIDLTIKIIKNTLKIGGLLIYQSHASGVDTRSQDYLKLINYQLSANGFQLLPVYRFVDFPAVHLVVGFNGSKNNAIEFLKTIRNNPEITTFHGKAKNNLGSIKGIKKIYDILN